MELYSYLKAHPVVYVSREHERAEGFPEGTEGFRIYSDITKSTRELMETLKLEPGESVVIFKPNRQVEDICTRNTWPLLNPGAELAERVEAKISQTRWLGDVARYLPPFAVRICKELRFTGEPVIIQFNHGHSGLGTILADSSEKIEKLKNDYPLRPVRITRYVRGPVYTSNNIVSGNRVLTGSISYQITGVPELTDNQFATVGNDWGLGSMMPADAKKQFNEIVEAVGKRLARDGWKGCFGIDATLEENTGKVYLLEVNARQTASVAFESQLQRKSGKEGLTTFEAHMAALCGLPVEGNLIPVSSGSRLIKRINEIEYKVIPFPDQSVMTSHGKLKDGIKDLI